MNTPGSKEGRMPPESSKHQEESSKQQEPSERISLLDPETANGMQKLALESALELKSGRLPNSYRAGAHAPFLLMMLMPFIAVAAPQGGGGQLTTKIKEMAVIKTSHINGCGY